MDIDRLIETIIPPNDFEHRDGFNNSPIIDELNREQKKLVEHGLIKMLEVTFDLLIVETLEYLQSVQSLPLLYSLLESTTGATPRITIASSIHSLNSDVNMIDVAIAAFRKLETMKDAYHVYRLLPMFYKLRKFHAPETDRILEEYTRNSDFLLSYNSKQALRML
jgi:hypothetical protein